MVAISRASFFSLFKMSVLASETHGQTTHARGDGGRSRALKHTAPHTRSLAQKHLCPLSVSRPHTHTHTQEKAEVGVRRSYSCSGASPRCQSSPSRRPRGEQCLPACSGTQHTSSRSITRPRPPSPSSSSSSSLSLSPSLPSSATSSPPLASSTSAPRNARKTPGLSHLLIQLHIGLAQQDLHHI